MLDINIEFTKGVLFIRLEGVLNDSNVDNIKNTIMKILDEGGIRYLVFNVHNLKIEGDISLFNKCEEAVKINDGKMLICGLENEIALGHYSHAKDELAALREFSVC